MKPIAADTDKTKTEPRLNSTSSETTALLRHNDHSGTSTIDLDMAEPSEVKMAAEKFEPISEISSIQNFSTGLSLLDEVFDMLSCTG